MGSAFVVAFQLIQGSSNISVKNTVQEEGNFVLRKISWAMMSAKTISIPMSQDKLTITEYDGDKIIFCLDSSKVKVYAGSTAASCSDSIFLPLTTENIQVTALKFQQVGISPNIGVTGTITIKSLNTSPLDFIITKYIRN